MVRVLPPAAGARLSDDMRSILAAGIQAPSGDNSQPWSFGVSDGRIDVRIDKARARSLFEVRHVGALLSLGAVAENMLLRASELGQAAHLSVAGDDPVVSMRLERGSQTIRDADLAGYIYRRHTNRWPHARRPLSDEAASELEAQSEGDARIRVLRGRARAPVRRLVVQCDRIRWEHMTLVRELFSKIRFTPVDKHRSRDGMSFDTLGVGPGLVRMLRWLSKGNRVRRLNHLGLSRMMAAQTGILLRLSGAFAILSCTPKPPRAIVQAGRAMQRMWLTATRLGLAVQPMASLPLLSLRAAFRDYADFSPAHRGALRRLHEEWTGLRLCDDDAYPIMIFRLGHGPRAIGAVRKPVETFLEPSQH